MADDANMQVVIEATNDTQAGFDSMTGSIEAIQKLIEDMAGAFESFSETMSNSMKDAAESVDEITSPIDEATNAIEDLGKAAETINDENFSGVDEWLKALQDQAEQTTKAFEDISTPAEDTASTSEQAFSSMTDSLKGVVDQADAATKAIGDIGKASETSGEETTAANDSSGGSSGGSSMKNMGLMMAAMQIQQATDQIKTSMQGAIDSYATFDQSMRLVNEEAGLNQTGFKNLETSVMNLSNQTGISANELSQGLYNIMSTGLVDAAGGMKVLQAAAEGAKAGNASLDDTTKALDSVMGAYGMKASSVNSILDIMFKATNDGQMHFDDLATSVGASATSAAMAGVSYGELAASQATLTNVGKSAQLASQQLNSLIMGMIAPTAGATKEAKSLGIEWDGAALKSHGLSGMIDEATKATGGNEEELKKLIPNQRAWQAAVALGSTAHALYTKTLNDMKDASGSADTALTQANQGAGDSIEKMKTEATNAGMELVASLAPAITSVIGVVENMIKWFDSLSDGTKKFIGIFLGIIVVIGSVVAPILIFIATLSMIAAGFVGVTTAMLIGWALIAVGVIAVVALIVANWSTIKTFFTNLWNAIVNEVKQVWNDIGKFFQDTWKSISDWTTTAWNDIGKFFTDLWQDITDGVTSAWNAVSKFFVDLWNDIKNTMSEAWNAIVNVVMDILKPFIQGILDFYNNMKDGISEIMDGVKEYFSSVWDLIKNIFLGEILLIIDLVTGNFTQLQSDAQNIWNNIKQDFSNIWDAIGKIFDGALKTVEGFLDTAWTHIKDNTTTAWNSMISFFNSIGTSILNWATKTWTDFETTVTNLTNDIINGVTKIWNGLMTWFGEIPGKLEKTGSDMFTSMKTGVDNTITGVYTSVTDGIQKAIDWITALPAEAITWGKDMIQGFINGIESMVSSVVNAVSNVANSIRSMLHFSTPDQGPLADYETWMPDFIQGMTDSLNANKSKLVNSVSGMASMMSQSFTGTMNMGSAPVMAGGGGNGQLVINIQCSGNITKSETDLANTIQSKIWDKLKSTGKF